MKKLLIMPLLALLTGCVTYYYPETALEDGVYYAEDDPSYTVYSDSYVGVGYYPWYSLDYFYLGYYPYPRYRVTYGYPGGFYLGFNYGFSPWYYPSHHYGYYSPWYASYHHYPYYPAWRPYRGYYAHHHGDRHWKNKHHDRGYDRYAKRGDRRDRNDRYDRGHEDYAQMRRSRDQDEYRGSTSVRRYVSTAPGGRNGERGAVIRSREATKIGKSELQVGRQGSVNKAKPRPSGAKTAKPTYQVRRQDGDVRYRSGSKQSRSRTAPVASTAPSVDIRAAAPARGERSSAGARAPRATGRAVRPSTGAPARAQAPARASKASATNSRSRPPKASRSSRKAPGAGYSSRSDDLGKKGSSRRKNRR